MTNDIDSPTSSRGPSLHRGKVVVSKEVYALLDKNPTECNNNAWLYDEIQSSHPEVEISYTSVCNASRRWRVKGGKEDPAPSDPTWLRRTTANTVTNETVESKQQYEDKWEQYQPAMEDIKKAAEEADLNVPELFKEVLKWKKYADNEGVPTRLTDIITIMHHTNQLNQNKADIIKDEEYIESICSKILEFLVSVRKDPDVDDTPYTRKIT